MVASNAAAINVIATLTNSQCGGGNTVTCRPRPRAMARSHRDTSHSCAQPGSLEPGVWSLESGVRSLESEAYSVLSARIGSSAAARRAGSKAAAIATMARTIAAEV